MARLARELEIWRFGLAVGATVHILMPNLSANQKPASRGQGSQIWPLLQGPPCHWPTGLGRCISSVCKLFGATRILHSAYTASYQTLPAKSAAMAPKAEKKPAKKVAKKVAGGKGKKGKSKVESFKIYIYKVLKQVRATRFLTLLSVLATHYKEFRGMALTVLHVMHAAWAISCCTRQHLL